VQGGVMRDEASGAVIYTDKTKQAPFEDVRSACPFNIPRQNLKTKVIAKCTMCFDRQANAMPPACVQSCPTGAMVFGGRKEILELAAKRVDELKKTYPQAMALNANEVRVIYLVTDEPKKYHQYAAG
jgi:formate dehydrogenase iron-sulfur subunit